MKTIPQTKHKQSAENLALLNLVAQYGEASFSMLFDQFGDADERHAKEKFAKRLGYLIYTEQLQATGRGYARLFAIGPMAGQERITATRALKVKRCAKATKAIEPTPETPADPEQAATPEHPMRLQWRGPIAEPRTYDCMHAPIYQPSPLLALRPGAMNYKAVESRGYRC